MRILAGGLAALLAAATAARAADDQTKISFKLKKFAETDAAEYKKALAGVEGVASVDLVAATGMVEVTVKENTSVKLSSFRTAVTNVSKEASIDEDGIVLVGKVWIHTQLGDALAAKGLEALRKLENVEKVDGLVKIPELKGNGYELHAKSPKGVKLGDLTGTLQAIFEKKSDKAVSDVQWFGPEKKKKKGGG